MPANTVSQSSLGCTVAIPIYLKRQNWEGMGVGLIVNFTGPTNTATGAQMQASAVATATVQVTNDPNALSSIPSVQTTARWIAHPVLNGLTNDLSSSIAYPVLAVRLNITSYTSGTVMLQVGVPDDI
jgi:hypothetical protein